MHVVIRHSNVHIEKEAEKQKKKTWKVLASKLHQYKGESLILTLKHNITSGMFGKSLNLMAILMSDHIC